MASLREFVWMGKLACHVMIQVDEGAHVDVIDRYVIGDVSWEH